MYIGFRLKAQKPPEAAPVTDGVVQRFDHLYEIDPARMQVFPQQDMPVWDTKRIVAARWDHLAWMHDHFADSQISGDELLAELEAEKNRPG
ncbi:MAG: hypothetical protein ACRDWA_09195 [Acidimicrobiia bacterium]